MEIEDAQQDIRPERRRPPLARVARAPMATPPAAQQSPLNGLLEAFASAPSLAEKWQAARRLIASKERAKAADDPLLLEGLRRLDAWSRSGQGVDRLVAIGLMAGIADAIPRIAARLKPLLAETLREPLPPLSLMAERRHLPERAEPAALRENVADALAAADGDWVLAYAVKAFFEEDRSQRCRRALWRQAAKRSSDIDRWFTLLLQESAQQKLAGKAGLDAAMARLRDIAAVLAEAMAAQHHRLTVTPHAGALLADLARSLAPVRPQHGVPRHREDAVAALTRLLDTLIAVRLSLMTEAELYQPVQLLWQWWSPLPYPAEVTEALAPIIDKLAAGIVFRARSGERSPGLRQRLEQALNSEKAARARLVEIAESEPGLPPDVQDWLRGIDRTESPALSPAAEALAAVGTERFLRAFAPLFLAASENETPGAPDRGARLASLAKALGAEYGLELVGRPGDQVTYAPLAHEMAEGQPPVEGRVRLARPMVVRRRGDHGMDVIVKALVTRP
jgi:hypothetical protein